MPILIDAVRISGFRGIENLQISLPPVAVLVGPNNCGKTSVIKSLELALGDYGRRLSDEDFHIGKNDARSERIVVDVRIVPMSENGERLKPFDKDWIIEFGEKIQSEADGAQFFAFRTQATPQPAKTGFLVERYSLREWLPFSDWLSVTPAKNQKISGRSDFLPFISIDAQRDIHHELNEKTSFIGKVLSQVKYEKKDVEELEAMIADINRQAVEKSEPLASLKSHLKSLNDSFGGDGGAEVTPFPKKLRDLSKNFSVHFGDSSKGSFSMEYHGMGTRSWASMLAVKAFTDLMGDLHDKEEEPFHPIVAAEEPEAHLHPNAQRSLFSQLSNAHGQSIISTHSPYLAAMCELPNLRSLSSRKGHTQCFCLGDSFKTEELKTLHREVLRNKGELLFSKAIILFEGQTEEQVVPAFFERWFGATAFSKGVNLVSVNGRNYAPFVKLGLSLGIPVAIVSDNDAKNGISTHDTVNRQIAKIPYSTSLELTDDQFQISFLADSCDFEAEIIMSCDLRTEVIEAFLSQAQDTNSNEGFLTSKREQLEKQTDDQLISAMRNEKTAYSGFLSDVITMNNRGLSREAMVPLAFQTAFRKVEEWLQ